MKTTHTFSSFPTFTELTFGHKEAYEALIADFPPIYDISFPGLMAWWNPLNNITISKLNDNLVIPYWLPGDEINSGLSLIGTKNIDESICEIFDYLQAQGEPVRLVNVPEFTVQQIKYHELFHLEETRRLNECIVPLSHFYPLGNMVGHWRKKVEKQFKEFGAEHIVATKVDLNTKAGKDQLLSAVAWRTKNPINDFGSIEDDCMTFYIKNADRLGIDNLCLYVDNELYGFCLYKVPSDKRYVVVKHIKATHQSMFGFELIAYVFSRWFTEQGFSYVNLGADYDIQHLRMFMVAIGANNFFRKYTIEPWGDTARKAKYKKQTAIT